MLWKWALSPRLRFSALPNRQGLKHAGAMQKATPLVLILVLAVTAAFLSLRTNVAPPPSSPPPPTIETPIAPNIPAPGEGLRWKGHQFLVLAMDGPRIERVQIERPVVDSPPAEDN